MFEIGKEYIIGGRYYWCVGFNGIGDAVLVSGAIQVTISNDGKYKPVATITPGNVYTARQSIGSIKAGEKYLVSDYRDNTVTFEGGEAVSLEQFAALFH